MSALIDHGTHQRRAGPILRKIGGKNFRRYPVHVRATNTMSRNFDSAAVWTTVTASSAAAAANWVRDEIAHAVEHPTEITAIGPRGGHTERFIGYESMIGARMARHFELKRAGINPLQLTLC